MSILKNRKSLRTQWENSLVTHETCPTWGKTEKKWGNTWISTSSRGRRVGLKDTKRTHDVSLEGKTRRRFTSITKEEKLTEYMLAHQERGHSLGDKTQTKKKSRRRSD